MNDRKASKHCGRIRTARLSSRSVETGTSPTFQFEHGLIVIYDDMLEYKMFHSDFNSIIDNFEE